MLTYIAAVLYISSPLVNQAVAWLASIYFADGGLALVICYMLILMVLSEQDLLPVYKQVRDSYAMLESSSEIVISPRLPSRGFWLAFLTWPSVQWLGKMSFGLFLFHMAIIKFIWYNHWKWPNSAFFMLCISYLVAGLLSTHIEQPIYDWATKNTLPTCRCSKRPIVGKFTDIASILSLTEFNSGRSPEPSSSPESSSRVLSLKRLLPFSFFWPTNESIEKSSNVAHHSL